MAKVKAKREPRRLFTVTFKMSKGDDIVIPDVMVKDVALGEEQYHWMELTRKGNNWLLLKTPGFLFEPLVNEPQVLSFDRSDETWTHFVDSFGVRTPVARLTGIRSPIGSHCFYAIDIIKDLGIRIQLTNNFGIPQHHKLIDITFEVQQDV